jgi:hypothetical protein
LASIGIVWRLPWGFIDNSGEVGIWEDNIPDDLTFIYTKEYGCPLDMFDVIYIY